MGIERVVLVKKYIFEDRNGGNNGNFRQGQGQAKEPAYTLDFLHPENTYSEGENFVGLKSISLYARNQKEWADWFPVCPGVYDIEVGMGQKQVRNEPKFIGPFVLAEAIAATKRPHSQPAVAKAS